MARESLNRIKAQLLRPAAKHVLMEIQISRRLCDPDPSLPDQSNGLDLKLSGKYPPCHNPPPVSKNTLFSVSTNPAAGHVVGLVRRQPPPGGVLTTDSDATLNRYERRP